MFLLRELRGRELRMELSWNRRFRSCRRVTERSSNTALALPTMYTLCRNSHWLLTAQPPAQLLQSLIIIMLAISSPEFHGINWVCSSHTSGKRFHLFGTCGSNTHLLTGGQLQHHGRLLREQSMDGICNTVQTERNSLEDKV